MVFYEGAAIVPLGCAPKSLYTKSMVPSMVMSKKSIIKIGKNLILIIMSLRTITLERD